MQYCLDSLFSVRMVAIFCFWGDMAMARTKAQLSAGARLADYLTVGSKNMAGQWAVMQRVPTFLYRREKSIIVT